MSWIYVLPALVMGILATVFAHGERKAGRNTGMVKAGYVMGIVSLCLAAAIAVLWVIVIAAAASSSGSGY
jgi:hypothetical protein